MCAYPDGVPPGFAFVGRRRFSPATGLTIPRRESCIELFLAPHDLVRSCVDRDLHQRSDQCGAYPSFCRRSSFVLPDRQLPYGILMSTREGNLTQLQTALSQTHTNGTRNPEIDEQLGEEEEQVAEEKNKLQRKKNKLTGKDRFRVRVTVYLSTITSRGLYIHQSHTQTTKPKAITETDQPGLFGLLLPTCQ